MNVAMRVDSPEEGRIKRLDFIDSPDESLFEKFIVQLNNYSFAEEVLDVLNYAMSVNYKHDGLSSVAYLAHPIRVAAMYLATCSQPTSSGVKLALLHNLLEVSDKSKEKIKADLGEKLLNDILVLTVNRNLQWDLDYKKHYYAEIERASQEVSQVKIIDKLDNLYILSTNKCSKTREMYLCEIEKFILPLAEKHIADLSGTILELVEYNRKIGYVPR